MESNQNTVPESIDFLNLVFKNLQRCKLDVSNYFLDHICFRTENIQQYLLFKNRLLIENTLLTESEINGRAISVFKLKHPLEFQGRKIPLLELPSPKKGSFYPKGWEHVEFVIPESLDDFLLKNSHLNFDKKGFSKKFNRDLRLKFDGISVKFHEQSLEEVIRIENS